MAGAGSDLDDTKTMVQEVGGMDASEYILVSGHSGVENMEKICSPSL